MGIEETGRQIALSLVNLDDIVLARELSGNGRDLLVLVGRSLIGTAVVGAGLATRAAVFGAQIATKSAMATTEAAKGLVPGAEAADQIAYDLDRQVGTSAQTASFVASRGVELGKTDGRPPTEPIFGDVWLGKRLEPGSTWSTVLADSAVNLSWLAALPLTLAAATVERTITSPAGRQVTRMIWDSASALLDSTTGAAGGAEAADRAEQRAMLLALGLTPWWLALQDGVEFSEGVSRAAAGDLRKLRVALTQILERLERADPDAVQHTPTQLLAALDEHAAGDPAGLLAVGAALMADGAKLAKLAALYSELLAELSIGSLQSMMDGGFDVDGLEAWVRVDEENRSRGRDLAATPRPPAAGRFETTVAESAGTGRSAGRGFLPAGTIDLTRDTIFSYSVRALGRDQALERIERLFGIEARHHLADDCSLRDEVLDAKGDRDRRLGALVSELKGHGVERLRTARTRAAARLATLASGSREDAVTWLMPQRLAERADILRRFIGLADTAAALDGVPSEEGARQRVFARCEAWLESDPADASEHEGGRRHGSGLRMAGGERA